jgi:hypothetical protein
MTFRVLPALVALCVLAACEEANNRISTPQDSASSGDSSSGSSGGSSNSGSSGGDSSSDGSDSSNDSNLKPISSPGSLPPTTSRPTPDTSLFRSEQRESNDSVYSGNGYAHGFAYDSTNDTFTVRGLPFDGEQAADTQTRFARANPGTLNTNFALYEQPGTVPDFVTGNQVPQSTYRVLYGVSASGNTEFAIARTGSYTDFGFGGFVYQRNNGVTLPAGGQATYSGDYAGLIDANGAAGLRYAEGDMTIDIDYGGFQGNCTADSACSNAIRGQITNRNVYDMQGNDLTQATIAALNADNSDVTLTSLPTVQFKIGAAVMNTNGEASGTAFSVIDGSEYEKGTYYAVLSGDHTAHSGEVVGIIVLESSSPSVADGATLRETGGFILTR